MTPLSTLVVAVCLAVNPRSDYITAGELAAAVPGLESVAPETPVALAPAPGVRRIFHAAEIARIAGRREAPVAAAWEVCFERRVAPLAPSALKEAIERQVKVA